MTIQSYVLGIISALSILGVVFEMLRRGRLRERHTYFWLVAGVLGLLIAIFPTTLDWLARILGIAVPLNLLFFAAIAVLFLVCIQQAADLTKAEERSRTTAEDLALLDSRLRALESTSKGEDKG